jgi:hypothetical protein
MQLDSRALQVFSLNIPALQTRDMIFLPRLSRGQTVAYTVLFSPLTMVLDCVTY